MELAQHTLTLKQIRVLARVGCLSWEQKIRQPLLIDIMWPYDMAVIAQNDHLSHVVDYTVLAKTLQNFLDESHFQLIETLAYRVAQHLIMQFQLQKVVVTVTKPNVLPNGAAAVVECSLEG